MEEMPDNCLDKDKDKDNADKRGVWVLEDNEDADDTLLPLKEDMAAIDEQSYVHLGELRESDRKEAVGLLTKVSERH